MNSSKQQGRVAQAFIVTGVALGLGGMTLGMGMGIAEDFRLRSVHAHLNLIGFVAMFLAGLFYRATPSAAGRLAWTHYGLTVAGLAMMLPGVAAIMLDVPTIAWLTKPGSTLVFAGMALFLWIVASARYSGDTPDGRGFGDPERVPVKVVDDRQLAMSSGRIRAEEIIAEAARAAAARAAGRSRAA